MKTITYPEIYSSENVIRILSKKPQLPQAPIEPVKPIMPSDPGEYDSGGNRGCSLFVVIAGVIIFFVVMRCYSYSFTGIKLRKTIEDINHGFNA